MTAILFRGSEDHGTVISTQAAMDFGTRIAVDRIVKAAESEGLGARFNLPSLFWNSFIWAQGLGGTQKAAEAGWSVIYVYEIAAVESGRIIVECVGINGRPLDAPVTVKFVGGHNDGAVYASDSKNFADAARARQTYFGSHQGEIGNQIHSRGPDELEHCYEVSERADADERIILRFTYVGRGN
jgi:hypothetical protein